MTGERGVRDGAILAELLPADEAERRALLARHEPAAYAEDAQAAAVWEAWEARCGALVERAGGGPADRAAWAGLLVWLTRESARCGAFSEPKAAVRLALLCRRLLDGGLRGLVDPDEAVRGCLAALPATRETVPTRDDTELRTENFEAILVSRHTKTLVAAAAPLLPQVGDPELRAELAAWEELRERLI
ncbi:hypothetical protein [Streptomyces sp. CC210A]|uniref:hypothetical protein n=1 Tax=Streptomyces sp. CC210A TaxID=2898184 RepID=UPI001F1E9B9F|nr:hypothetical protein [Streptomyces sp. CC210A]